MPFLPWTSSITVFIIIFGETTRLGKILNFFLIFYLKSGSNFQKASPSILLYFWSYWQQNMLDKCLKSPISEDSSTRNMVNRPKHFKSPRQSLDHVDWSGCRKFSWKKSLLYHISSSVWKKLSWKKSLFVIFKILGLLNQWLPMTSNFLLNSDNLRQTIQMELSKKQKLCWEFFSAFLKWISTLAHSEKKDDPHSLCISKITDCKKRCYINV